MTDHSDVYAAAVAACPTPVYHETHRYCPSCPWVEEQAPKCAIRACGGTVTVQATLRSHDGDERLDFCERHLNLRYVSWDRLLPEPHTADGVDA